MDINMHKKFFKIFFIFIRNIHINFLLELNIDYIYLYIPFCVFLFFIFQLVSSICCTDGAESCADCYFKFSFIAYVYVSFI